MLLAAIYLFSALLFGIFLANRFFKKNLLFYGAVLGIFFSAWLSFGLAFLCGVSELNLVLSSGVLLVFTLYLSKLSPVSRRSLSDFNALLVLLCFSFFVLLNFTQTFIISPRTGNIALFFSDTDFHLSLVSSFSLGNNFPPVYPFLSAVHLTYYFLFDFFSGLLVVGGFNLLFAFCAYNVIIQTAFVFLLYSFCRKVLGSRIWAWLALFLVFFVGSLYAFEALLRFSEFSTPLEAFFGSAFWFKEGYAFCPNLQTIVDSRAFLMGFAVSLIVYEWFFEKRNPNIFLAALIGLLPLFHASFIPLSIAVVAFGFLSLTKTNLPVWLKFFAVLSCLALPQLAYLASNKEFVFSLWFGWTNTSPDIFSGAVNLLKNFGGFFFLFFVGLACIPKEKRLLLACFALPAGIGMLTKLSPWAFDNIKFFLFWALLSCIFGVLWLKKTWQGAKLIGKSLLVLLVLLLVSSGLLGQYSYFFLRYPFGTILKNELPVCAFIEQNLPKDAIILTSGERTCAYVLYGRKVFFGEDRILFTHGVDFSEAVLENARMLQGDCDLLKKYQIQYYYAGGYSPYPELAKVEPKVRDISTLIFENKGNKLYRINCE
ncbi:hypothetical protein COX86_00575 [Candidatus Micrarchaeota archaeon CG_4_10_14_0_2_um_filter_60_11]|nr:MAG: hypothetical protein AUJ16_00365 [Candidatus Micrarchaeota archaeon CG1_02_60_51]PIN96669.1 MAG: hypothetical protein COU39_00320 [Candidatus Micrarchaeota archaeon CG10_big_fil_rev_8_21_14_0_10_60_32]PIO02402.1 MAG: hypothetical protein COT58_00170 [Candidatus Micrarchaeota archaeon CG09_land_8_20_14_0_10_60_16]PIY91471.1 MAG: hypothetical protein COY71_03035 [Candidatus Micrarchaeota archaeon CG_4_10_14_0_8_um_filter_60_7]PIZ91278.1 MAG: hypothetical protein COX86_00575 [Candidatus Mi